MLSNDNHQHIPNIEIFLREKLIFVTSIKERIHFDFIKESVSQSDFIIL